MPRNTSEELKRIGNDGHLFQNLGEVLKNQKSRPRTSLIRLHLSINCIISLNTYYEFMANNPSDPFYKSVKLELPSFNNLTNFKSLIIAKSLLLAHALTFN